MKNLFIIAGFQRSGSTFLYEILNSHPEIQMNKPVRPEPKFFINNSSTDNLDSYFEKYFNSNKQPKWFGEKSTSYIEHEEALINYKNIFPNSKVLLILRNPIDRAISNYKFSLENGLESRSLEDVFINKIPPPILSSKTSVSPFNYIERGFYSKYIETCYKHFSRKEILILNLENLKSDKKNLKKIEAFLNISPFDNNSININARVNKSSSDIKIPENVYDILRKTYEKELSLIDKLS